MKKLITLLSLTLLSISAANAQAEELTPSDSQCYCGNLQMEADGTATIADGLSRYLMAGVTQYRNAQQQLVDLNPANLVDLVIYSEQNGGICIFGNLSRTPHAQQGALSDIESLYAAGGCRQSRRGTPLQILN